MGFSLGGNVLLKLLGERSDGGRGLVDAAVAMSVPYDLAAGSGQLEQTGMGRAYSAYFLRSLRAKVRDKSGLAHVLDLERALAARTIWSFDELVTAPLNGFRDAAHYYSESSSSGYLSGIGVPTLLLHAEDDPFLPPAAIPLETANSNQHLKLILHAGGGHVGFLAGSPFNPKFWADEEAVRFLSTHLSRESQHAPGLSQENTR
jgi:predicted alpha/beta-fold hydrolase